MSEWISVEDGLPDYNIPVLVCDEKGDNTPDIARLESVRSFINGKTHDFLEGKSGYDTYYLNVTHWMPLPDPPKPIEP